MHSILLIVTLLILGPHYNYSVFICHRYLLPIVAFACMFILTVFRQNASLSLRDQSVSLAGDL